MSRLPIIYQDLNITVTDDFIRPTALKDQVIQLDRILSTRVEKVKVGDYKQGAALFLVLSVIAAFIFPPLLLYFIPMMIGAWFTARHRYTLIVNVDGYDTRLFDSTLRPPVRRAVMAIKAAIMKRENVRSFA